MLQLSPAAAQYLSQIRKDQDVPPDAPLRISSDAGNGSLKGLQLEFVSEPRDGDQVNDAEVVTYCVARDLVEATDSVMIDIEHHDDGATFIITEPSDPRAQLDNDGSRQ